MEKNLNYGQNYPEFMNILSSASKLTLLMLVGTICFLMGAIVFNNPNDEKIIVPLGTAFIALISAVGGYYFGKGQEPQPGSVTVTPADKVSEVNTSVSTSGKDLKISK